MWSGEREVAPSLAVRSPYNIRPSLHGLPARLCFLIVQNVEGKP
jgi:hypothetical protein